MGGRGSCLFRRRGEGTLGSQGHGVIGIGFLGSETGAEECGWGWLGVCFSC